MHFLGDDILETKIIRSMCDTPHSTVILQHVDEHYFYNPTTKEIYQRIQTLIQAGKPIPSTSVLTLDESMSDTAKALLSQPMGYFETETDVIAALAHLKTYRDKTILFTTMLSCVEKIQNDKSTTIAHVLTAVDAAIHKCRSGHSRDEMKHYSYENQAELLKSAHEVLQQDLSKDTIPTGFADFDRKSGGLKRKNVLVLASTPGGGKSAMALQMCLYQYMMGFNVCLVSYEMDRAEIEGRLFANVSKINHADINLRKLDPTKRRHIVSKYKDWIETSTTGNKLTIWTPERELTVYQIALELKPLNYDIIYIDYLGLLLNNPKKQMWENLGEHSRASKLAATNLDAALVVLAQFDDETNRLKYSKAIQANANFVWVWAYGDKERETGIIEIQQKKARNAPVYNFYLETDYSVFSFSDYRGPPLDYNDSNDSNDDRKKFKKRKDLDSKDPDKKGIPKMPVLV